MEHLQVSLPLEQGSTRWGGVYSSASSTIFLSDSISTFETGGVERMRIDSSGNVGIGNSSPVELLTIGSTSDTNVRAQFLSSTSGANTIQFGDGTGTEAYAGYINYTHSDNVLAFATDGTERMRIDSDGATIYNGKELRVKRPNGSGDIRLFNTASYATLESTVDPIYIKSANAIRFDTGGNNQRMLLDTSGNLLVGTTSTIPFTFSSGSGAGITSGGTIMAGATAEAGLFNRVGSDGAIIQLYKAGGIVGSIGTESGNVFLNSASTGLLSTVGTARYKWDVDQFYPNGDNAKNLGTTANRFNDIYATNGTIQTSDRNEKQDIAELSEAEQRV